MSIRGAELCHRETYLVLRVPSADEVGLCGMTPRNLFLGWIPIRHNNWYENIAMQMEELLPTAGNGHYFRVTTCYGASCINQHYRLVGSNPSVDRDRFGTNDGLGECVPKSHDTTHLLVEYQRLAI